MLSKSRSLLVGAGIRDMLGLRCSIRSYPLATTLTSAAWLRFATERVWRIIQASHMRTWEGW